MGFYLVINILIILVGIFIPKRINIVTSSASQGKTVPIQCLLLFIILFIFLGFRGDFTSDYNNYSIYFEKIYTDISISDIFSKSSFAMENGFIFISKVISYVTHSELAYHAILSFGLLILFFRVYNKHSDLLWLTILLFVNLGDYFGAMNLFRQVLAAAIVFSGFDLIAERKLTRFFLLALLATTIHTSALVMIVAYFILVYKRNIVWNIGYGAIFIVLWFLLDPLVNLVGEIFPKYHDYHYGMGQGSINAVLVIAAIYIFAEISLKFFVVDYQYDKPINLILLNGTFLCLLFLMLGVKIYMLTRVAYFFRPFACLLVPNILAHYSEKKTKNIIIAVVSLLCVVYTHITLSGTGYDPYYFYNGGV